MPTATSRSTVPPWVRFLILNIEPLFALNGVILALFSPATYTAATTRGALSALDRSSFQWLMTELGAGWAHFAFTGAVVLRLVDDLRTWRLIFMGMLLSDLLYIHSCAQAVGGWYEWLRVWNWTPEDWALTVVTWPFPLIRIGVILGAVGRREREVDKHQLR